MKPAKKDNKQVLYAILAAIIFVAVGFVAYTQLAPHKTSTTSSGAATVQVVTPIQPGLNTDTLSLLNNVGLTKDFSVELNTASGLGNPTLFGD